MANQFEAGEQPHRVKSTKEYWQDSCPQCGRLKHKQSVMCYDCRHPCTRPPVIDEVVTIKGVPCRYIPLTRGLYAIVDASDYEWLMRRKWRAWKGENGHYYAISSQWVDGKTVVIKMHRAILGLTDPMIEGDHADRNGLNNTRKNLRIATRLQNSHNMGIRSDNVCGYKGVYKHKYLRLWHARITANGITRSLGYFKSAEAAARARDKAALELHGEFAVLNFPV